MKFKEYINESPQPVTFVRFGGLSKVKYKKGWHGTSDKSFHTPPVKKGIFAFIWPYIEDFLWVWKIKSKTEEEYKKLYKQAQKERKKFNYRGMVWCHFVDQAKSGRIKGSWVEVHTDELGELLKKVKHFDRKELMKLAPKGTPAIDPYKRGLGGFMSMDHLEVFIEKVN